MISHFLRTLFVTMSSFLPFSGHHQVSKALSPYEMLKKRIETGYFYKKGLPPDVYLALAGPENNLLVISCHKKPYCPNMPEWGDILVINKATKKAPNVDVGLLFRKLEEMISPYSKGLRFCPVVPPYTLCPTPDGTRDGVTIKDLPVVQEQIKTLKDTYAQLKLFADIRVEFKQKIKDLIEESFSEVHHYETAELKEAVRERCYVASILCYIFMLGREVELFTLSPEFEKRAGQQSTY